MKSEPFSITLSKKKKQSAFYNASSTLSKLSLLLQSAFPRHQL